MKERIKKTTYTKAPGLGADGQERVRVQEATKVNGWTVSEKTGFVACDPGTADALVEALNNNEMAAILGNKLATGLYEVQLAAVEAPAA